MPQTTLTEEQYNKLLDPRFIQFINQLLEETEGLNGPVLITEQDLAFYVDSTGDDDNDGLTSETPMASIAGVVSKFPNIIAHEVQVHVGPGTFDGFELANVKVHYPNGSITIQGTLGAPTLTTGTTTGTSDGGSTTQLIDSGQTWTTNELRGKLLLVDGEYRVIKDNNGTTINVIGPYSATASGKAYSILEQKTILENACADGASTVSIRYCECTGGNSGLVLKDLKIDGAGNSQAAYFYDTVPPKLERIYCLDGTTYGLRYELTRGAHKANDLFIYDAGWAGLFLFGCEGHAWDSEFTRIYAYDNDAYGIWWGYLGKGFFADYLFSNYNGTDGFRFWAVNPYNYVKNCEATNNGRHGVAIHAWGSGTTELGTVNITDNTECGLNITGGSQCVDLNTGTISNNGDWGIHVEDSIDGNRLGNSVVTMLGNFTIASNTSGGILLDNRSSLYVSNTDGTNTGAYGIELRNGSYAQITSATGITGATGDLTINGGNTVLDYTDHFGSDGDLAVNQDNLCYVVRKD